MNDESLFVRLVATYLIGLSTGILVTLFFLTR